MRANSVRACDAEDATMIPGRDATPWLALVCWAVVGAQPAFAQALRDAPPSEADAAEVPQRVDVTPIAQDEQIARRLTGILNATGWFDRIDVRVEQGVVFLNGATNGEDRKQWAGRLVANTQDAVAVVNDIQVTEPSIWDFSSALKELRQLSSSIVRRAPLFVVGASLLLATWYATKWSLRGASSLFSRRPGNRLLRGVAARIVAVPVFLLGLYIVLSILGLTGLAATVIGGTGLIGLIIGFAFRDIAENFLASLLIGRQRPFAPNDLIEVAGRRGFVQSVNTRSTLLMTEDGNHVQIPNATIYKGTIINFTANPIARFDFTVGIGYDDSIAGAQSVALTVLGEHAAVLADPDPMVLVETLGAATVNLRIYFWIDVTKYSQLKVRSAVIRLTKRAFTVAGISMPDESREVVFPHPLPVRILPTEEASAIPLPAQRPQPTASIEAAGSSAEDDLTSDAADIKRQAIRARLPEGGSNLLES
jgi:small conductance mechanosensitive channel